MAVVAAAEVTVAAVARQVETGASAGAAAPWAAAAERSEGTLVEAEAAKPAELVEAIPAE